MLVRCPVSVFTNQAHGVGIDAPDSVFKFTLRHATSVTQNTSTLQSSALQLRLQFLPYLTSDALEVWYGGL